MAKKRKTKAKRQRGGATMACPTCGSTSHVLTTRRVGDEIVRRRQCARTAGHRFETREVA